LILSVLLVRASELRCFEYEESDLISCFICNSCPRCCCLVFGVCCCLWCLIVVCWSVYV